MKNSDLKILWGKAAGRCAICKQNLILFTKDIVVGEMAHIIANSPKGPRGKMTKGNDTYDNLVLLCPTHHTEIDKNSIDWDESRLKDFKTKHERWVVDKLDSGEIGNIPFEAIINFNNELIRREYLHNLLWMNWGNARFLNAMRKEEDYSWLRHHADKEFRHKFPEYLDELFFEKDSKPPFGFSSLNALVVFPENFEECQIHLEQKIPKPKVPLLLHEFKPIIKGEKYNFIAQEITELPQLPLKSGYIAQIDEMNLLPTAISEEPCAEFFGAFYWVKPFGLRTFVTEIGVIDPLECLYGKALWWSPKDARSFIGVRAVRDHDDEMKKQFEESKKNIYSDMMLKYTEML